MNGKQTTRRLLAALLTGLMASPAFGQCDGGWLTGLGLPGLDGTVWASTVWDPDGEGPATPLLVVAGSFSIAGDVAAENIATWDPVTGVWGSLGSGLDHYVYCLGETPDGDLLAGGYFQHSGTLPLSRLASWDGSAWSEFGGGVDRESDCAVQSVCVLPDGDVVVGGRFDSAGQTEATNIARWDGSEWHTMDGLHRAIIYSLATIPGGRVLAGGSISYINGEPARGVAIWDGSGWSAVGEGLSGVVQQVGYLPETRQTEGRPQGRMLAVSGGSLQFWDGAAWTRWDDPDGIGIDAFFVTPAHELVGGGWIEQSGGDTEYRVGLWRSGAWDLLGGEFSYRATSFAVMPDDTLIASGTFERIDDRPIQRVGKWSGESWEPLSTGIDGYVRAIAFAPNGDTYIGGRFRELEGVPVEHVGVLRDGMWLGVGGGVDGIVNAVRVMSDGSLVVGGYFDRAGGVLSPGLSRWDGSGWAEIGNGPRMDVWEILELSDGRLLVGGKDRNSSFPYCLNMWDGESWSRGWASFSHNSDDTVYTAVELPGGDLVVGGRFDHVNGVAVGAVARWDGTVWHALAGGMGGVTDPVVYALAVGPGGELYAGGYFTTAGGVSANHVARWDGQAWEPLGEGMDYYVRSLAVSSGGALVAGGRFGQADGMPVDRVARWDGASWRGLDGTLVGYVDEIAPLAGGDLLVGGIFAAFGERVSSFIVPWDAGDAPWIAVQPKGVTADAGSAALLHTAAEGGPPLGFQWRFEGQDLADGPTPHGSIVSGSDTDSLAIENVRPEDAGGYDCRVTNGCGQAVSITAGLVVRCRADFDGNGIIDTRDFVAFLDAWGSGDPAADFDGDGAIDTRDFVSFLNRWASGC